MTDSAISTGNTPPPLPRESTLLQKIRFLLFGTPIAILALYFALSLWLGENFPFSNFPMYSNPSAERMYYTISGPDGKGLPIATLTGTTDPKIGKIFRTKSAELRKKLHQNSASLTKDQEEQIGREMLGYFRGEARNRGEKLPASLQLNRIIIDYENGRIVETPTVIAREQE